MPMCVIGTLQLLQGNSHRKSRKQLKEACNGNGGFGFKSFHALESELICNGEKAEATVRRAIHPLSLPLPPVLCPGPAPFSPIHLHGLLTITSDPNVLHSSAVTQPSPWNLMRCPICELFYHFPISSSITMLPMLKAQNSYFLPPLTAYLSAASLVDFTSRTYSASPHLHHRILV